MATVNHYFQSGRSIGRSSEQNLYEDLIIESMKIYGLEVYYIPRKSFNEDKILTEEYSKKNPFMATVLEKVKITGDDSDKEVFHIELSIEESGLTYEPGDSVGIFEKNPEFLVEQILQKTEYFQTIFQVCCFGLKKEIAGHQKMPKLQVIVENQS